MLPHVVRVSVCMSVCLSGHLSHLCTGVVRLLDGVKCCLAGTLVWSQVTLYQMGPNPPQEGEIWGVKICIANCSQTVAGSRMIPIGIQQRPIQRYHH